MTNCAIGYISSRPFWHGTYLPQRLQNIAVKHYCDANDLLLKWSLPESSKANSYLVLENMTRNIKMKDVNAIVFASFLQLPFEILISYLKSIIAAGGSCHSAIENTSILTLDDISEISDTLMAAQLSAKWITSGTIYSDLHSSSLD